MGRFGSLLRAYRLRRKLTQSQLAKMISYDQSLLSKVERGERTPTPEFMDALCNALALSESEADEMRAAAHHVHPKLEFKPWSLVDRPVLRRALYWFVAGNVIFVFFFGFLFVRLFFFQRNLPPLYELVGPGYLAPHWIAILVLAVLLCMVSIPIGYLVHQIYFALYCNRSY